MVVVSLLASLCSSGCLLIKFLPYLEECELWLVRRLKYKVFCVIYGTFVYVLALNDRILVVAILLYLNVLRV